MTMTSKPSHPTPKNYELKAKCQLHRQAALKENKAGRIPFNKDTPHLSKVLEKSHFE